jgi:tripartite motif-containing protein 71
MRLKINQIHDRGKLFQKKQALKILVFCMITFSSPAISAAGEFTFENQWGFICPSLFGCPAPNGFWGTSSIAVATSGTIYVYDIMNNRVHQYDNDGTFQGHLTACPDGNPQVEDYCTDEGEINYSPSIAVSPDSDYVYISDPRNYRIHKFSADGTWVLSWGILEDTPVFFREPSGIAVGSDGSVYVTDILDSAILRFDDSGTLLERWTHPYASGNDFRPTGIFATDDGIYVTDYMNSVLYLFGHNGKIDESWGMGDGTMAGEFTYPSDVAVDDFGNVFVADSLNNRIQVLSDDNWAVLDGGVAEGPMNRPFGIATDTSGNVFVADTFNNRVLKYIYTP